MAVSARCRITPSDNPTYHQADSPSQVGLAEGVIRQQAIRATSVKSWTQALKREGGSGAPDAGRSLRLRRRRGGLRGERPRRAPERGRAPLGAPRRGGGPGRRVLDPHPARGRQALQRPAPPLAVLDRARARPRRPAHVPPLRPGARRVEQHQRASLRAGAGRGVRSVARRGLPRVGLGGGRAVLSKARALSGGRPRPPRPGRPHRGLGDAPPRCADGGVPSRVHCASESRRPPTTTGHATRAWPTSSSPRTGGAARARRRGTSARPGDGGTSSSPSIAPLRR